MDHDSNPFELYQSYPGWKDASIEIAATVKAARIKMATNEDMDPYEAYKAVNAVLRKHVKLGAEDSEPRWHAAKLFCKGTDMDPAEFY